ncbi:major facilitator superfamily mfs1 protein [Vairimorpha apis BRL 01]|uniref:Major facilitator superfamily mfs1 protein n=1 Tax=Vairimorpha apis BRL 01 TaxID=1037528 RepID=T0LAW0_9MICR|nr:major facilitator superfamily mfs1 protein [Vairimorpha apis BRL 01]
MLLYLGTNLCTTPLTDKIVLEYLSKIPNLGSKTYGTQRLWGTVGYAVCNYIVEFIVTDEKNEAVHFNNLRMYNVVIATMTVALCYYLITWDTQRIAQGRNDIWSSFKELITNYDYMFFIFIILLNGLTRASMTIFITVYWKDILKMKPYELPLPGVMAAPINIFNKNTTTQGSQMLRFVFYWMLPYNYKHSYAVVCGIELLKGLNFGLTHCSAVHLATKLCPPHLKATSQMLYQGTFTGLGSVLAGVLCSFLFSGDVMKDKKSSRKSRAPIFKKFFLANMAFTALTLVLFFIAYGVVENVLFNSENEEKKLEMYSEKNLEEEAKNKLVDKNTVTNK